MSWEGVGWERGYIRNGDDGEGREVSAGSIVVGSVPMW